MTDSAFDSSQVDNARIEIMMVVGQIKQLLICGQRLLVVSGFRQVFLFFTLTQRDNQLKRCEERESQTV